MFDGIGPEQTLEGCAERRARVARDTCRLLPTGPGVYRFRDVRGGVIYLGRATNLRERTLSYWGSHSDRPWLARMVPQIAAVEALECAGVHEASWLERNLLRRARPRWNRMLGGLEVPAWLVLDPNPRRPSLRLTSGAPGAHPPPGEPDYLSFGPYLGVVRARQLRSGLLRVWPVDVTGTATERSRRELATLRGHSSADMGMMVGAIAASLNLDPDALARLRDGLRMARDAAAAGLAFELAGQIHDELHAANWASQPQRVTRTDLLEAVAVGWCAGVALRLEIRDGRLHRWDQQSRPHPPASVSAPPDLADFAAANAHLAARLLGRV